MFSLAWNAWLLGWWYPVKACLAYWMPGSKVLNPTYHWSASLMRRYDVRPLALSDRRVEKQRRVVILSPHRTSADFFVHKYLTDGYGATLSRGIVAALFPVIYLATRVDHSTWFFKRDARRRRGQLFEWLDCSFDRWKLNGLIVYPEGHRNNTDEPLKLKSGLIHYAYERAIPIQTLMTWNTERIADEKSKRFRRGVVIPYAVTPLIDPANYDSRQEFYAAARSQFDAAFAAVRDAARSDDPAAAFPASS